MSWYSKSYVADTDFISFVKVCLMSQAVIVFHAAIHVIMQTLLTCQMSCVVIMIVCCLLVA